MNHRGEIATMPKQVSAGPLWKSLLLMTLAFGCALSCGGCKAETSNAEIPAPSQTVKVDGETAAIDQVLAGPSLCGFIDRFSRETNQLVMAEDYVGKSCEVSGKFENLQFLEDGSMKIVLSTGKTLTCTLGSMSVVWSCVFDNGSRGALRTVRQGQDVTIHGRFGDLIKAQGDLCYQVLFYDCTIN